MVSAFHLGRFDGLDKKCSKCGRMISQEDWDAMPLVGHQVIPPYPKENDPGEVLEMRNCECGSTLTILEPFTAAELEAEVEAELRTGSATGPLSKRLAQQLAIQRLKKRR